MKKKKGLYLYCVRKKKAALIKAAKTMNKGEVYTFPYQELEAVVSEIDLKKFSSEEIQKKAEGDVNWIKEKAQIHEHVIEQAMALGGPPCPPAGEAGKTVPVIPMKFGVIFKTKGNLEQMMGKYYSKFKVNLEKLKGKQEWGVKIYLNEEIFEKQFKDTKPPRTVTRPARRSLGAGGRGSSEVKELESLPKGMDFFVKKQMEEVVKKKKGRKLQRVLEEVFGSLKKLALEANQGKILDKALTEKTEPMVLSVNLLIGKNKLGEFQKEIAELKAQYQKTGFIIQESGPWPPYSFV